MSQEQGIQPADGSVEELTSDSRHQLLASLQPEAGGFYDSKQASLMSTQARSLKSISHSLSLSYTWPNGPVPLGCSVTKSCRTLCGPMDCSSPGFPVLHYLPELAQTHIHRVSDAIQPSHPLSSPSPPSPNPSQHQGLFQWVGSSHQVAKVLELRLQHQSFQRIFRVDFFRTDWLDFLTVQGTLKSLLQHQLKSINSSMLSLPYGPILTSIHDYCKNHV